MAANITLPRFHEYKQVAEFFVEQHVLQPSQVEDVLSEPS